MKTREIIHARIKALLPEGATVPPLTAIETLLCEAIDEVRQKRAFQSQADILTGKEAV